jgi:hypothetical protein
MIGAIHPAAGSRGPRGRRVLLTTLPHAAAHADGLVSVVLRDRWSPPRTQGKNQRLLAATDNVSLSGSRCRSLLPRRSATAASRW